MPIPLIVEIKHWLLAFAVVVPRVVAIFTVLPCFGKILHGQLRNSIVVSICLILIPFVLPSVPQEMDSIFLFTAIVAKEVVVGLLMGFLMSVPFWAIEGIGFIIDNQRGSTMASVFDPMSGEQTSLYGSLFLQLTTVVFFTTGGFLIFVGIIFNSYLLWPIDSFIFTVKEGFAIFFLNQMDFLMELMALYAAPVIIAIFFAEFGLGLINRFAPQLNVFFLSMPIKSALAGFFIIIYISILEISFRPRIMAVDQTVGFLEQLFK